MDQNPHNPEQPPEQPQGTPIQPQSDSPMQPPQGMPAQPQQGIPMQPYPGMQMPPMGQMRPPKPLDLSLIARILMLIAAFLLTVAFFLPWWSANVNVRLDDMDRMNDERAANIALDIADATVPNIDWYIANLTPQTVAEPVYDWMRPVLREQMSRSRRNMPPEELDITFRLWGWSTLVGGTGLAAALVAVLVAVVPWVVRPLRDRAWVAECILFVGGFLLVVYTLIFIITCPGENVSSVVDLKQGISVGPFLGLLGAIALAAGTGLNSMGQFRRMGRKLAHEVSSFATAPMG